MHDMTASASGDIQAHMVRALGTNSIFSLRDSISAVEKHFLRLVQVDESSNGL